MLEILNVLPLNLIMRILIVLSGIVTLFFFAMTICEMLHTFWSFWHPKADWYQIPKVIENGHQIKAGDLNVKQHHHRLINVRNGLVRDFWIGIVLITLLIVIFPLFHI